jgi:hypothetical protein
LTRIFTRAILLSFAFSVNDQRRDRQLLGQHAGGMRVSERRIRIHDCGVVSH